MAEGQMILIKDSGDAIDEVRYLIYAWLHENNLKSFFKITRPMPDKLAIYRKKVPRPVIEQQAVDPSVMQFITSTLIDFDNEDEVIKLIRKRFSEPQAQKDCLDEWRRIMARDGIKNRDI